MSTATLPRPNISSDEFLRLHGDESGIELVDGQIVRYPMPGGLHGEVCSKANFYLVLHVMTNKLGRVLGDDTFIRTSSNPDSYLGADICFIGKDTLPPEQPTPTGPISPPLELVVEVRSPSNSVADMTEKAAKYTRAGVKVVLVLDPQTDSAGVFRAEELPQRFHNGDVLELPDILPGFSVPVAKFFE